MAKLFAAFMSGTVLIGLLGAGTYFFSGLELFVIVGLGLITLAFLPLLIRMWKAKEGGRPTLFGTSTPGSFSTISYAQSKGTENKSNTSIYIAGAGLGGLIVFLLVVLLQYV